VTDGSVNIGQNDQTAANVSAARIKNAKRTETPVGRRSVRENAKRKAHENVKRTAHENARSLVKKGRRMGGIRNASEGLARVQTVLLKRGAIGRSQGSEIPVQGTLIARMAIFPLILEVDLRPAPATMTLPATTSSRQHKQCRVGRTSVRRTEARHQTAVCCAS